MNKKLISTLLGSLVIGIIALPASAQEAPAKAESAAKPKLKGGKKGSEKSCSGGKGEKSGSGAKKGADQSCGAKSCGGSK